MLAMLKMKYRTPRFPEHNPTATVISVQTKMYLFLFQFMWLYLESLDLGKNQDSAYK